MEVLQENISCHFLNNTQGKEFEVIVLRVLLILLLTVCCMVERPG